MQDAGAVRDLQSFCDFHSNFQQLSERQCAPAQALGERLAVEELHDEEVGTVLRAYVVEMADVRMIQRGNGAGFALKTLLEFGIVGEVSGENLDGDNAIEARVFRAVDLSHAAGAERCLNLIRTQLYARGEDHACATLYRPYRFALRAADLAQSYPGLGAGLSAILKSTFPRIG